MATSSRKVNKVSKVGKVQKAVEKEESSIYVSPVAYMHRLRRMAGMATKLPQDDIDVDTGVYVTVEFTREQIAALEDVVRHVLYVGRRAYEETLEESGAREAEKLPYAKAKLLAEVVDLTD